MIIGFGYKAGVGKDESADYLCSKYGFVKTAFAKNLKDCCKYVFRLSDYQVYDSVGKQVPFSSPVVMNESHYYEILNWMRGYLKKDCSVSFDADVFFRAQKKTFYTPRDVLQYIGTDVMREHEKNYHVLACTNSIEPGVDTVISDVRFTNEAKSVHDAGGSCVRIDRNDGIAGEYDKQHASETGLDSWCGWDYIIDNNSNGIPNLHNRLDEMMEGFYEREPGNQTSSEENI